MKATSFEVFAKHIDTSQNPVNVNRLFTKECVQEWVKTRKVPPKQPVESFRRTLTAHVKGADQRRPFPKEVEAAILRRIRTKEVWEGFVGIGRYGFRGQGYHEKAEALEAQELQRQAERRTIKVEESADAGAATTSSTSTPGVKSEDSINEIVDYGSGSTRQPLPTSFPPTPLISEAIEQINLFDASLAGQLAKRPSESTDAEIDSPSPKLSRHPNRQRVGSWRVGAKRSLLQTTNPSQHPAFAHSLLPWSLQDDDRPTQPKDYQFST